LTKSNPIKANNKYQRKRRKREEDDKRKRKNLLKIKQKKNKINNNYKMKSLIKLYKKSFYNKTVKIKLKRLLTKVLFPTLDD